MGHLARKPHLCDTVSMHIHREVVNDCGTRKASTGRRNWNSKIRIHLDIPTCSGRSRGSLSCSGWSLHCLSPHVTRQRGCLWTHRGSGFIHSLDTSPMAVEPRLLERAIQGLKWHHPQPIILSLNGMQAWGRGGGALPRVLVSLAFIILLLPPWLEGNVLQNMVAAFLTNEFLWSTF